MEIAVIFVWIIFFSNILPTYAGIQEYQEADTSEKPSTTVEKGTIFRINGEKIILDPEMQEGTVGEHNPMMKDTIAIKSGRSLEETKETCEHELLHEKGAKSENHEPGDYIYEIDEHMNSETCIRLIYELGRYSEAR